MADKILIIGREEDPSIPMVEQYLDYLIQIVDPGKCISGTELSYKFYKKKLHISYDGNEIKNIRSVWYRKPRAIHADNLGVYPDFQQYSETAVLSHSRELYVHFEDAYWISNYYAIRRADYKALQQKMASLLNFNIPDTVATSDPSEAKRFVDSHSSTIVKSAATAFPNTKTGEPTMFYSQIIYPEQNFDYTGLQLAPAIFQETIKHQFDIRVTVVGNKLFSAAIHASDIDSSLNIRDWRPAYYYGNLEIEKYKLPKNIEDKCLALVKNLGLEFGAIDLICDTKGKIWFLENNPNGEWAFIEQTTGQSIAKSIATNLNHSKKV